MTTTNNPSAPLVGVVMGSSSDWDTMQHAVQILQHFGVAHDARVVSAHRMPDDLFAYAEAAAGRGLQAEHPAAVAINVTVVGPAAAGYSTVYRGDLASPPGIASINYVTGQTVNNALVVAINQSNAVDYQIYSLRQANYVVDIVGFFDTPHATALDCTAVNSAPTTIANGAFGQAFFPACNAGYARTGFSCETGGIDTPISGSSLNFGCAVRNNNGVSRNLTAISTCCRVPGR